MSVEGHFGADGLHVEVHPPTVRHESDFRLLELLADPQFRAAGLDAVRAVPAGELDSCRLGFRPVDQSFDPHTMVFEGGRLRSWEPGADEPCFAQGGEVHLDMLLGGDGTALTAATSVMADGGVHPIPPADVLAADLGALPRISTGSLRVGFGLERGPAGQVHWWEDWTDGQRVACGYGEADGCDIVIVWRFDGLLAYRLGEADLIESLRGGSAAGPWAALMLAAGVGASPEYVEATRAAWCPAARWLRDVGAAVASPAWLGLRTWMTAELRSSA